MQSIDVVVTGNIKSRCVLVTPKLLTQGGNVAYFTRRANNWNRSGWLPDKWCQVCPPQSCWKFWWLENSTTKLEFLVNYELQNFEFLIALFFFLWSLSKVLQSNEMKLYVAVIQIQGLFLIFCRHTEKQDLRLLGLHQ